MVEKIKDALKFASNLTGPDKKYVDLAIERMEKVEDEMISFEELCDILSEPVE